MTEITKIFLFEVQVISLSYHENLKIEIVEKKFNY